MRTTIIITDLQWEWIKQKAINGRASISEVVRQFIDEDMIANNANELVKKKPKELSKPIHPIINDNKGNMTFEL